MAWAINGTQKYERLVVAAAHWVALAWCTEPVINSALWCTTVWMAKHPCTWLTFAAHCPQSHLGSVSDLPADNFSIYCATGWVLLPDELFLWQACRLGTHCLSIWETRPSSGSFRKQLNTFVFALPTWVCRSIWLLRFYILLCLVSSIQPNPLAKLGWQYYWTIVSGSSRLYQQGSPIQPLSIGRRHGWMIWP